MRSLRWTPEHSVFVPEIDAQHQEMFRLAEELRRAVLAGEKPGELELLRRRLASEIAGHLSHEERLMRAAEYPAFDWHERQHQTARAKLITLKRDIESGEWQAMFESLESLAGWMRDHTSVADRMAGAYLRNHWRASACAIC